MPSLSCICEGNEKTKSCSYEIYTTSRYGLTKKELVTVNLNCVDDATSDNPIVEPIADTDNQNPQIIYFSPIYNNENYYESEDLEIIFEYEASDNNAIKNCSFYVNENLIETSNNSTGSFIYNFQDDILTNWEIVCEDFSQNIVSTELQLININSSPYKITTCVELQDIMDVNLNGDYYLQNNIDCSDTKNWNYNGEYYEGFSPIGDEAISFSGSFDGQGYLISELSINNPTKFNVGLFGIIDNDSKTVKVNLVDVNIIGSWSVGGIAGNLNRSNIEKSYISGNIFGGLAGGAVGYSIFGFLSELVFEGEVKGALGSGAAGGLVGSANGGAITNSYSIGSVIGLGENIPQNNVGGVIGEIDGANVSTTYSVGVVSGNSFFGGLVGYNKDGSVYNSFYNSEISGQSDTGKGEPKTTAQMTYDYDEEGTFDAWDFEDVWAHDTTSTVNNGYPYLQWQTE